MKKTRLGRWARAARCCFFVPLALWAATSSHSQTPPPLPTAEQADLVIDNFARGDLAGWTVIGETLRVQESTKPDGSARRLLESVAKGDRLTGRALSPEFVVQRDYINFRIGGDASWPDVLGVNLLRNGSIVRAASGSRNLGTHGTELYPVSWDIRALRGSKVRIEVLDEAIAGIIRVASIMQSNRPTGPVIDASTRFEESLRPAYHFTAPQGFLADPKAPFYYRGKWHLIYLYTSLDSNVYADNEAGWNHRWAGGHAVSGNLLEWTHLPDAIPGNALGAVLGGTAVIDWTNSSGLQRGDDPPILAFYTRVPYDAGAPDTPNPAARPFSQCFVYSTDGAHTWHQYAGNPILETGDIRDRDPKVFRYDATGEWFMLLHLSARNDKAKSAFGLFRSTNLHDWKQVQTLPGMWEVPEMYELPLQDDPARRCWILSYGTRGLHHIGTFDGHQFSAETPLLPTGSGKFVTIPHFFVGAPTGRHVQITCLTRGRRVQAAYRGMPFEQQMGIPVDVTLRRTENGLRLAYAPVQELVSLRRRSHHISSRTLSPGVHPLGIDSELLDIELAIDPARSKRCGILFRGVEVAIDQARGQLTVLDDTIPLPAAKGVITLRILTDRVSLEIFGDEGLIRFGVPIFPPSDARGIALFAAGGDAELRSMTVHELAPRGRARSPQPDKPSESASVRSRNVPNFGAVR